MPALVALGSFATTLLGGVAALRIGDRRHLVLGLAVGLMLGVVLSLYGNNRHASHPSRFTLACTIAGAGFMWLVIGPAS